MRSWAIRLILAYAFYSCLVCARASGPVPKFAEGNTINLFASRGSGHDFVGNDLATSATRPNLVSRQEDGTEFSRELNARE